MDGSGIWLSIQVLGDPFDPVGDTIPHSTMGNLAVGNFDLQSAPAAGAGFIYNLSNPSAPWSTFNLGGYSTTFYGVWQNGGSSSTKYTIVGGISDVSNGGNVDSYLTVPEPSTYALFGLGAFAIAVARRRRAA